MNQLTLTAPTQPELTHKQVAAIWNSQCGLQVKWDEEQDEYTSTTGDRLVAGTVEERVEQLVRMANQ